MSSYQKFDTSVIRKRIKDGAYPTLAGANRAIGKTQGLSEDDKNELKKYAAKHFGADAPAAAPAKKTGKKASKKAAAKPAKTAKKAAKKAAKKTAKRAPKAAAASDTEADTTKAAPAEAVAAAPARRRGRSPAAAKASQQLELPLAPHVQAGGSGGTISTFAAKATLMGNVIGTCDQMLRSITMSNNLIPKEVAAEGSEVVAKTMTRAVQVLDRDVVAPLLQDSAIEKVVIAKPKRTPPPKPKNPPTTASTVAAATPEEIADGDDEDSLPLEALGAGDDESTEPELTEEERQAVEAMHETMPANLPAGLRVPGVNSAQR